jgi:hypothetical protein
LKRGSLLDENYLELKKDNVTTVSFKRASIPDEN